jgi:hypothetical protein
MRADAHPVQPGLIPLLLFQYEWVKIGRLLGHKGKGKKDTFNEFMTQPGVEPGPSVLILINIIEPTNEGRCTPRATGSYPL